MIDLISVNTYASMAVDYIAKDEKAKCEGIVQALTPLLTDRQEILNKLEEKASASGSDNSWNRYESADQAYAYGEQLKVLLEEFTQDEMSWEDIEWQLADLVKSTGNEMMYRLERAQW